MVSTPSFKPGSKKASLLVSKFYPCLYQKNVKSKPSKSFINEESSNLVQKIQEGTLEKYPELNKKQVKSFSFVMFLTNRAISRMLYLFKDINCMEGWIIQINPHVHGRFSGPKNP